MKTAGGAYSQLIRLAQILLPLTALSILATLFLLANNPSEEGEIPYADVEAIARENRLSRPSYSGVTRGGETVTARARVAQPEGEGAVADHLGARIETASGEIVDIAAGAGHFSPETGAVRFTGLARVESSTGYRMETGGLTLTLDTGHAISDGTVEIRAPFGRVEAGQMEIIPGADGKAQRLVFQNGVRLLYKPKTPDAP